MAMLAADVSKYLGWEQDITLELAERAPKSYRRYFIEKKRGGKRAIFHPSKKTKAIQYALMNLFLSKVPIHKAAMGYVAKLKSPLRTNAEQHAKYSYNMRLDMKNFFPSIIPDDLFNKIQSMIELTDENRTFLRNVLFIAHPKEGIGLAIGAPSSPIISNIVMIDLDELFCNLVKSKDGVYTRYSDDMMFSVHQKGECNEILEEVRGVLGSTDSPNLELNEEKTYFMSRKTRRSEERRVGKECRSRWSPYH